MSDLHTRIAELAAKATPGADWLAHEYSNSIGSGPVMIWDSPCRRNACIECVPRDLAPLLVELLNAVPAIIAALTTQAEHDKVLAERDALQAENARLREANGILEDALQEVGDDYPGSSCQEWCIQQIKAARAALEAKS